MKEYVLSIVRVTEAAALTTFDWIGRGHKDAADQAAVNAMRSELNKLNLRGTIVIGEGERDKAPMLYIGEEVGSVVNSKKKICDVAVDPIDGTVLVADGLNGAISTICITKQGGFLHAPDVYMEKIAVGAKVKPGEIDLDNTLEANIINLSKIVKKNVCELVISVQKRPRHDEIVKKIRTMGAKVVLFSEGDIMASLSTAIYGGSSDMFIGTGGAPEGVLAAAGLKCLGGFMQARLLFQNDAQKNRAFKMNQKNPNHKYSLDELASGDIIFCMTAITDCDFLKGIKKLKNNHVKTSSIVMRSKSKTVRYIDSFHNLLSKKLL